MDGWRTEAENERDSDGGREGWSDDARQRVDELKL